MQLFTQDKKKLMVTAVDDVRFPPPQATEESVYSGISIYCVLAKTKNSSSSIFLFSQYRCATAPYHSRSRTCSHTPSDSPHTCCTYSGLRKEKPANSFWSKFIMKSLSVGVRSVRSDVNCLSKLLTSFRWRCKSHTPQQSDLSLSNPLGCDNVLLPLLVPGVQKGDCSHIWLRPAPLKWNCTKSLFHTNCVLQVHQLKVVFSSNCLPLYRNQVGKDLKMA